MSDFIVGVIGPGRSATPREIGDAHELGRLIAEEEWIVLSGGRDTGVTDAVSTGAREIGGLTVGIVPGADRREASAAVDIPIITGMGNARYDIEVLSSDVLIACGMECGPASQIALALEAEKIVIFLNPSKECESFFKVLRPELVRVARSTKEAIEWAREVAASR